MVTLLRFIKLLRVDKVVIDAVSLEFLGADGQSTPPTLQARQFPLLWLP